jgi:SAM-dependent methyltransferase
MKPLHESTRLDRRRSFNEVAVQYDRARPAYPAAVVDAVVRVGNVQAESNVLEIGCGSGQLTIPLAAHGGSITALELGAHLAALASQRAAQFPRVQVIETDFDRWPIPRAAFNIVVAATSFHWLDPDTRLSRCLEALRSDGVLLIIETHWGAGSGADPFFAASQDCYARWDPDHDPNFVPTAANAMSPRNPELEQCRELRDVRAQDFVHTRNYTAAEYGELLRTFSNVHALGERSANGLVACIEQLINMRFGGAVIRKDVYRVWSARRERVGVTCLG